MALAGFADEAHARLSAISDDELVGVLRGLAAADLVGAGAGAGRDRRAGPPPPRRPDPARPRPGSFPAELSEWVADEVADGADP